MNQSRGTQITCPNCRQPFTAILEQIIDAGRDPQAKARLLSGRTNLVTCPHCGYQTVLSTPLIYHDAAKQLLIVHMPMELNLPQREQDRLIGNLTNAIINSLPPDQRKGYLFTPKSALTLQSLVEMVLEGDGITSDVLEAQRQKMGLVETFMQADPDSLEGLVKEHDAELDLEFFTMLTAATEAALTNGRRDMAEQILALRDKLLELSSTGKQALQTAALQEQAIQEVANALNALGDQASYRDIVDLTLSIAREGTSEGNDGLADEKLRALVGLARPMMDYTFFQELTQRVDAATGDEKAFLASVRDLLLELTRVVDQQQERMIQNATETLRAIVNSPDPDAAIRERLELIDDTFLAVLSANIQKAEQNKDVGSAAKLKLIFDKIVGMLQESAPPAVKFINELMSYPTQEEAEKRLADRVHEFGGEIVQWMDMLSQDLASRSGNSGAAFERLLHLREAAAQLLAEEPKASPEAPAPKMAGRPPLTILPRKSRK
ncbi:MAG TPA: CpXC domain-containing protein [Aggregatilineales bacterium]|nr:CpXC domain-containing protein [Aggregatilineales bacterium]